MIADSPAALQLRYLQTLSSIAAEKNSTIVFPVPLELFRGYTGYPDNQVRSRRSGEKGRDTTGDSTKDRMETRFEDLDISIPDPDKFHPEKILAIPPTVFDDREIQAQIDFSLHPPIVDYRVHGHGLEDFDTKDTFDTIEKGGERGSESDPSSPIPISTSISVLRSPLHHKHHHHGHSKHHAPPPPPGGSQLSATTSGSGHRDSRSGQDIPPLTPSPHVFD